MPNFSTSHTHANNAATAADSAAAKVERSPAPAHERGVICAVASAPSASGAIGIVRASGPAQAMQQLLARLSPKMPLPRVATLLPFRAADESVLDTALTLWFPEPHSYTGESVLELQVHGGPVLLRMVLQRLLALGSNLQPPMRLARPGEFTERAWLNGKLDLLQAEGVADLISAQTEGAVRGAARSLSGAFSNNIRALRESLIALQMQIEAAIDFGATEDIPTLSTADVRAHLHAIFLRLSTALKSSQQGALLRGGATLLIVGQPNVGKSALFNALVGSARAIVTDIAGTTRDILIEHIQIRGVPIRVLDSAGLRSNNAGLAIDKVEELGMERTLKHLAEADVLLWLGDISRAQEAEYRVAETRLAEQLAAVDSARVLRVWNKVDLQPPDQKMLADADATLLISSQTGAGLEKLQAAILEKLGAGADIEDSWMARERHLDALNKAQQHVHAAQVAIDNAGFFDLIAEEVRLAQRALGSILGEFSSEDLLGEIFAKFCIGK